MGIDADIASLFGSLGLSSANAAPAQSPAPAATPTVQPADNNYGQTFADAYRQN